MRRTVLSSVAGVMLVGWLFLRSSCAAVGTAPVVVPVDPVETTRVVPVRSERVASSQLSKEVTAVSASFDNTPRKIANTPLEADAIPVEMLTEGEAIVDGGVAKSIYANPRLLMEFADLDLADGVIEPPFRGARLVRLGRAHRVWLLPDGLTFADAKRKLVAVGVTNVSEVFHGGASTKTGLRALPGGVMLQFDASWEPARIEAFAREHGLRGLRPMTVGAEWRMLPSEPGAAGLALVRRLRKTGQLVSVSPNWWRERSRR